MLSQQIKRAILVGVLISVVSFGLRISHLGSTMTVDESNWMLRSGTFWHKLFRESDIGGTFLSTHPGATLMWVAGGGIVLQEERLGFDIDTSNLRHFRKAALLPVIITISLLTGMVATLLALLVGPTIALTSGLLLAAEPYLVGMGQVVHLDAMMALLMLISFLSWLLSLKSNQRGWRVTASVFFGMALATRALIALWLLPMIVLTAVGQRYLLKQRIPWWRLPVQVVAFIALGLLVVIVLWPTVLTQADFQLGYIARDTKTIIQDEHVALSISDDPIAPASFYIRTWLGRLTPLTQILTLSALAAIGWSVFDRKRRGVSVVSDDQSSSALSFVWLLVYGLGFLVLITLAAKKADRYALPALAAFPLVAGWVAVMARQGLRQRWSWFLQRQRFLLGALVALVLVVPVIWSPHAIAYNNPLFPNVRPLSQQGWGEGLELAAAWLNKHPLGENLTISSWYPSVMATYFNGKTFRLSSRDDYRVGYVVTYRNMGGRAQDSQASDVLDEVRDQEPVQVFDIQGVPYVWVYETNHVGNFIKHVNEVTAGVEVGQVLPVDRDDWSSVDIGFATFSARANTEDIILQVRESVDATESIRTVRVNAADIVDNEWQQFSFDPIADSAGKDYYIAITSPTSRAGNAVTVRYTDVDLLPGQMVFRREPLTLKERTSDFIREGDIAYRLGD